MIRKFLCAFLLLIPTGTHMLAQEETVWGTGLVVNTTDGRKLVYPLDQKPKVTFSDTGLILTTSSTEITLPRENVKTFSYDRVPLSGIDAPATDICAAQFPADGTLYVAGCEPGAPVNVFSVEGVLLYSVTADDRGSASIAAKNLGTGIYLVKAGDMSYKILKR